jgi:hypothetical protein
MKLFQDPLSKGNALTSKISGPFWWILGLKCVFIDIWGNDKNEMMFSTTNHKILYLIMLIVYRKNLSQTDLMDCKIIIIEGEALIVNVLNLNRS